MRERFNDVCLLLEVGFQMAIWPMFVGVGLAVLFWVV